MGTSTLFTNSGTHGPPLLATALFGLCSAAISCVHDTRDMHAARKGGERTPSQVSAQSASLCSLVGPYNHTPGVWGADLGFSAHARDDRRITLLFGDTWAAPVDGCQYPPMPSNDMQSSLPLQRPASLTTMAQAGPETPACDFLETAHERPDDATSWRRARLFPSPSAHRDQDELDMSGLRTPLAAFSDGEKLFGLFQRNDAAMCSTSADCPSDMPCSTDPAYHGLPVGACSHLFTLADDVPIDFCRDSEDCVPGTECEPATQGVCLATKPFDADTNSGPIAPSWYREDPKRGIVSSVYVAAAIWPEHPADYATIGRFNTHHFQNAAARSVAYFDPEHPELNDYRPGYHTLLVWGRSSFVTSGGAQALPFLLYVPLDELRGEPEHAVWRPRFFAGYDEDGYPVWSERESEARPIYGDQARVTQLANGTGETLEWIEPEFDQVSQMTLSWVAPLSRWVMMYGGDLPAFMVLDPRHWNVRDPVHRQWATGAIHMRTATHPWGAARIAPAQAGRTREHLEDPGWSSAEPMLTRQDAAPFLGCASQGPDALPGCKPYGEGFRPFELVKALARGVASPLGFVEVAKACLSGEIIRQAQDVLSGDSLGRLYAPNIIDDWTEDVTSDDHRARGERSAELYWNVSTWNPYQVVLFKTRLTARSQDENEAMSMTAPRRANSTLLVRDAL